MKKKVKSAIYLKDVQLFLDECIRTHEPVTLLALTQDGKRNLYEEWLVVSAHWRAGTHDLRNPKNGEIRKVRDVLIFSINGHPVYI